MPDVEDQQRLELVCIRKLLAHVMEIAPDGVTGSFVPSKKFLSRIRVQIRVLPDGARTGSRSRFMLA